MSCDCNVTCLFIVTKKKKKKKKEIQKKRNIKSRKIDKRKRKMLVSKVFHNTGLMKELNKMLGIETKLSMAYHPQMDG